MDHFPPRHQLNVPPRSPQRPVFLYFFAECYIIISITYYAPIWFSFIAISLSSMYHLYQLFKDREKFSLLETALIGVLSAVINTMFFSGITIGYIVWHQETDFEIQANEYRVQPEVIMVSEPDLEDITEEDNQQEEDEDDLAYEYDSDQSNDSSGYESDESDYIEDLVHPLPVILQLAPFGHQAGEYEVPNAAGLDTMTPVHLGAYGKVWPVGTRLIYPPGFDSYGEINGHQYGPLCITGDFELQTSSYNFVEYATSSKYLYIRSYMIFMHGVCISQNKVQVVNHLAALLNVMTTDYGMTLSVVIHLKQMFIRTFLVDDDKRFGIQSGLSFINTCKLLLSDFKTYASSNVVLKLQTFFALVASCTVLKQSVGMDNECMKFMIKSVSQRDLPRSATDIFILIGETLILVLENIGTVFSTGSVTSFFYDGVSEQQLDKTYADLIRGEPDRMKSIIDTTFDEKLDDYITKLGEAIRHTQNRAHKEIMLRKMSYMVKVLCAINNLIASTKFRKAPMSILLFGGTARGKTSLYMAIFKAIENFRGKVFNPCHIFYVNNNSKFDDGFHTNMNLILNDDLANGSPDRCEGNPTDNVLRMCNNAPAISVHAEISNKGAFPFMPDTYIATTNTKDILSSVYSMSPASILRRFRIHITVEVNPIFRKFNSGCVDPEKIPVQANLVDIWWLTLEMITVTEMMGHEKVSYSPFFNDAGKPMVQVSLGEALPVILRETKLFDEQQKALLEKQSDLGVDVLCVHNTIESLCQICTFEQQSVFKSLRYLRFLIMIVTLKHVLTYVPAKVLFRFSQYDFSMTRLQKLRFVPCLFMLPYWLLILIIMVACLFNFDSSKRLDLELRSLQHARLNDLSVLRDTRRSLWPQTKMVAIILASLYCLRTFYGAISMFYQQSQPAHIEGEKTGSTYAREAVPEKVVMDPKGKTMTQAQMVGVVAKTLRQVAVEHGDIGVRCNMMPIKGTWWLIVSHVVTTPGTYVIIVRAGPATLGHQEKTIRVHSSAFRKIKDYDLALVDLPGLGPQKDRLHMFPKNAVFAKDVGKLVLKETDGTARLADVTVYPKEVVIKIPADKLLHSLTGNNMTVRGLAYKYPTYSGLCGAVTVINGRIACVHTAGKNEVGFGIIVTQDMLESVMGDSFPLVDEIPFDSVIFGQDTYMKPQPHPKSPVNYLDQQAQGLYLGSHDNRRHFKTNVGFNMMSPQVSLTMELPCKHQAPFRMNGWTHWYRQLNIMTSIDHFVDYDILAKCEDDLFSSTSAEVKDDYRQQLQPVALSIALNGIDGVNGIDKIEMSTSSGWPFNSPKTNFIYLSDEDNGHSTENLVPTQQLKDQIDSILSCYRNGQRANIVFRSNLKDEAVKIGKEKVRVFDGSPLAFLLVVRMYTLGFCKMILNNSFLFECAVGINATSREWTDLRSHIISRGTNIVAGDYKSYDANMSVPFMRSAFNIIYRYCQWAEWDEHDLVVLRGIATDIIFSHKEFNGDYLMVFGSNPSGHPLTVFINNLANSLYVRYAFISIYPDLLSEGKMYNDYVSAINYGDDNIMGVSEMAPLFNHNAISLVLATLGVTYTTADKVEGKIETYISIDDADFLKRKWRYDTDLKRYAAPLDEDSISKMLHINVVSKVVSPSVQCASVLVSANNEYFQYGKEVFEKRHQQLRSVAHSCGLLELVDEDLKSWDQLLQLKLKH